MTGVKGAGGPVPKRSDQRRRRNKPAAGDPTEAEASGAFVPPKANTRWHPVAKRWFGSLADSGQSVFYEPSDWATAYVIAESISRELQPQPVTTGMDQDTGLPIVEKMPMPVKGASLAAWLKGMTSLLATEGDRRRAAIELRRPAPEEGGANVTQLDDIRTRLHGTR